MTLIAAAPDADAQLKGLCLARLLLAPRPLVVAEAGLRESNLQAMLAADGVKYTAALLLERRPSLSCAVCHSAHAYHVFGGFVVAPLILPPLPSILNMIPFVTVGSFSPYHVAFVVLRAVFLPLRWSLCSDATANIVHKSGSTPFKTTHTAYINFNCAHPPI